MFGVVPARGDGGDHAGLAFSGKGSLQHLGQLAAAEFDVFMPHVHPADALLQRQKRFVDLRPLAAGLLIAFGSVRTTFAPSKVDEGHVAEGRRVARTLQGQTEDGVAAGAAGVS